MDTENNKLSDIIEKSNMKISTGSEDLWEIIITKWKHYGMLRN
jgi:hypothetical protein